MTTIKLARRSANYSKAELDCLLRYLEDNPDLVSVRLGGQYTTPDDIRMAWDELADQISSIAGIFGARRTGQEVKRKWSDLKSRVKAKAASLAMEAEKSEEGIHIKLSPVEERVLAIISRDLETQSHKFDPTTSQENSSIMPSVKVFSFHSESNSVDRDSEYDEIEVRTVSDNANESEILDEIKLSGSEDKKRRISEAFSSNSERKPLVPKRLKIVSEEQQLQELCNSQLEINTELKTIKDILKKCQVSIEKLALLKRAELRLKCAKYGVEFEDLFD